jgi:hypothetical protein
MVGLPPVTHNMTCRNRLMERLKVPKSQKRLADDEKRQENEGGESRSNRIARSGGTRIEIVNGLGTTRGRNGHKPQETKKARAKPNKGKKRVES